MFLKGVVVLATIGIVLSLTLCFLSIITWEMTSVLVAVALGIPTLLSQMKTKPKDKKDEQTIKPEEKEILQEETIRVSPKDPLYYELELTRGDNLKGKISSNNHIDIYFVNQTNFRKWKKDKDVYPEYSNESVFETKIDYIVPRKGTWYLLLENNGRKIAKVKVILYI